MTAIVSLTLPSPAVEIKEASHVVMISHPKAVAELICHAAVDHTTERSARAW
jgi:hypothetical protein